MPALVTLTDCPFSSAYETTKCSINNQNLSCSWSGYLPFMFILRSYKHNKHINNEIRGLYVYIHSQLREMNNALIIQHRWSWSVCGDTSYLLSRSFEGWKTIKYHVVNALMWLNSTRSGCLIRLCFDGRLCWDYSTLTRIPIWKSDHRFTVTFRCWLSQHM